MESKKVQKKRVLIIDASPLFREFLTEKLAMENVEVETASGKRDAFTKMLTSLPDLIIIDIENSFADLMDFLQKKYNNLNAKTIPIVISGPILERKKIAALVQFGVVKYFAKPIKFDIFFESIGRILNANFSMDSTQCVLEIHHNDNIIFVEIAQGLNREKIALLKYKISEMIDKYEIKNPKLVVMMTNLTLSFVDGINVELLLDTLVYDKRIMKKNIKILSFDTFIADLIEGHPQYYGIKVIQNLAEALTSIVDAKNMSSNITDIIADTILTSDEEEEAAGSVQMRFLADSDNDQKSESTSGSLLNIAIVDDDDVIRTILQKTFANIGAETSVFSTGADFINSIGTQDYDLVILDIFMTGTSGLDILTQLRNRSKPVPVLIYSQATQREYVVRALSLGAKSYLVKPQKPEAIIQKAMEILHEKL